MSGRGGERAIGPSTFDVPRGLQRGAPGVAAQRASGPVPVLVPDFAFVTRLPCLCPNSAHRNIPEVPFGAPDNAAR